MRRGSRAYLAVIAALTASRISSAHDLVTAPDHFDQLPTTTSPTATNAEQNPALADDDQRPSALVLDLRPSFGLPLGEARTFAIGRSAADVAVGYLTDSGRYAGVTVGASHLDSSISGFHESTFQFGVDLGYRPKLRGNIAPWIGLGFAWQILWLTRADFQMKAVGPEFPIVRLGVDYRLGHDLAIGPFAAFAYRRYDPFSVQGQTPLELMSVDHRDGWIMLGVSASFSVSRL